MNLLRQYIRHIILENQDDDKEKPENLLTEPDEYAEVDKEQEEQSVAANVAGVTTPLGTGPAYPAGKGKKRKTPWMSIARAFGNAKLADRK